MEGRRKTERPDRCAACNDKVATGFKLVKRDGSWLCGPCAKWADAQLRIEVTRG